ncbi:alpha/beta fold hydrolase [Nigerium massiliense]|uniref:alpha/beta fold hydrolase n=1 Tax=Nigerium massiliense TaxID=1522317 RepID=UPI00058C309B|nr:alpha/beta fold hydrolase [Nigerium massiliense]
MLHTTRIGDGEPRLMFLHGFLGQGKNWTTVARGLAPLGASILVDLPNHGRSDWTEDFSYADMADSVAELVRAERGSDPFTLVGHSMGGKVAMAVALRHPDLLDGLVVVDISPDDSGEGYGFGTIIAALQAVPAASLTHRKEADAALRDSGVADAGVRQFLLQSLRHRPEGGFGWQFNLDMLARSLPQVSGWPDVLDGRYDRPVLWVRGARSDYVTEANYPQMMRLFPQTALLTVQDAGHWVHSEQPQAVIEGLRNFLLAEQLATDPGA